LFSNEGSCFSVSNTHKPALVLNSCHKALCEPAISHAFHFNASHMSSLLCKCNISIITSRFQDYATPQWGLCQACCMAWVGSWIVMFPKKHTCPKHW
jgi:hypothetical protein